MKGYLEMIEIFKEQVATRNLFSSFVLFLVVLTMRFFVIRALRKSGVNSDIKRQWIVQVKNSAIVLLFLGLFFVWGTELRTFAISVVAIAVAFVVAIKELIQCILGGILKAVSRSFKIGDRIELVGTNSIRGDVINHNFFTTTLFEIGPGRFAHQYTGKTIVVPNSVFLTTPILNEAKTDKYRLHTFSVFRPATVNINQHKDALLHAANEICSEYADKAQVYLKQIGDVEGLDAPTAEPRVFVSFPCHEKIDFIIRVPVESLKAGRTEQAILQKYITSMESLT